MNLDTLQARRALLKSNSDITLSNMQIIANESERVADVASTSEKTLDSLDEKFENATQLTKSDVKFLFAAVGLQLLRIVIINELTKIEVAGSLNRNETKLHEFQEKLLGHFNAPNSKEKPYYASMEHIITKMGVPYDAATALSDKTLKTLIKKDRTWDFDLSEYVLPDDQKLSLFKGANHRFATLGHDPIIGLVFGTGNIMTNTITCVRQPEISGVRVGIPLITTNHVIFTSDFKDPRIAAYGSTLEMLKNMADRIKNEPQAFVASLIKQIIHIGTDMFTPCGIQIPGSNLVLSNSAVEKMTSYFSWGDATKLETSALITQIINWVIGTVHMLTYDASSPYSQDIYNIRTRKIIEYSNLIATGSNVIWTGIKVGSSGNISEARELDFSGLYLILKKMRKDQEYIREIKREFVFGSFSRMIEGEKLYIQEINWDEA